MIYYSLSAQKDTQSARHRVAVEALQASTTGPEIVSTNGGQAYIVYPAGIGGSRLTNTLVERKLRTRGTARNWNTILKLASLAED